MKVRKAHLLFFIFFALPHLRFAAVGATGGCAAQSWHEPHIHSQAFVRDLHLLLDQLEAHHGGMYQYVSKEELLALMEDLEDCHGLISLHEAYYRMAQFVDALHDGHTWVTPSEEHAYKMLQEANFLPFTIKVRGNEMFIHELFTKVPGLSKGDRIISIDNMPVRELVRELLPYFTSDGTSLAGKLASLEEQFWWHYGLHFGFKPVREVRIENADFSQRNVQVKTDKVTDRITDVKEIYGPDNTRESPVKWKVEGNIAVLTVLDFHSLSLRKYKRSFLKALQQFETEKAEALVIDLRGNGGGREGVENLLLSSIGVDCSEKYDAVTIQNPRAESYRHIDRGFFRFWEDLVYRSVEFRLDETGKWQRRTRFSRTFKEMDNAFTGPVCVMIDRHVFSGASEFAALVKDLPQVLLLGEETCGGYQGHTSGYSYELTLPNTGFMVHIPRIWFDLNVPESGLGGVQPHIRMSSESDSNDQLLQYALSGRWVEEVETLRLGFNVHREIAGD